MNSWRSACFSLREFLCQELNKQLLHIITGWYYCLSAHALIIPLYALQCKI
jgi:hypothetical protein